MEPTNERVIEILKDNFYILQLFDYFDESEISIDYLNKSGDTKLDFDVAIKTPTYETILPLEIDYANYDEKFSDVDRYEVDDFGLEINIVNRESDIIEELNAENIWKYLFFEKEPIL